MCRPTHSASRSVRLGVHLGRFGATAAVVMPLVAADAPTAAAEARRTAVRFPSRDGPFGVRETAYHRSDMIDQTAVTLRAATAGDAPRIAAMFTEEGYPAGTSDIVARLARFEPPGSAVVVAEIAGEPLGFLAVHLVPRFEHGDVIVRIVALVVDASVRDRGLGHLLMAEAERIGHDAGAAFVEVTAGHHRPDARHLYESLGYDATVATYLRKRLV